MRYLTHRKFEFHYILLGLAAIILAIDPVLWLTQTWTAPSYDSKGAIVFLVCVGLFILSITSPRTTSKQDHRSKPFLLLGLSAFMRLIGQVAAFNIIGALTLVVDVYAISKLCALDKRARYVSPFWLSVCFFFSLPIERIIQRALGYGLQNLSADGACGVLGTFFDNVTCHGVRILINAQDVMVDLPCSGARSLFLLLFFYCVCAAASRQNIISGIIGGGFALICALIANIVRICILAIGIAFPVAGIDVMEQPYHDIIGLITLAVGGIPTLIWMQYFSKPQKPIHPVLDRAQWIIPRSVQRDAWWLSARKKRRGKSLPLAVAVFSIFCAVVIHNLPRTAIDVARPNLAIALPHSLNNAIAIERPLSEQERIYFTQFGGSAKKAAYGDHGLMMVKSSAPLRHLHAPDECLRGLGMQVEYKGPDYSTIPSAIYKATDTDGNAYRIAVSFISQDQSIITTNISEVVWRWMQNPKQDWTAVQRISPWHTSQTENNQFDHALMAALDLETNTTPIHIASLEERER